MDKRTFIKTSSAIIGGSLLSGMEACSPKQSGMTNSRLKNWAGSFEYSTGNVHYPETTEQLQDIILRCDRLRPLGSRHSFNRIADSKQNLVSMQAFNKVVSLDKNLNTITVEGGIKYGELCQYLYDNGYALHNLASLPHISIAGSVATATHGSGVRNGNLATSVSAIEFVNASGEIIRLSRQDGERFYGAVVGLGALGVVTKITLDLLPAFEVRQVVYRNLAMAELEKNLFAILSAGYSVSLFTDWRNKKITQLWIKTQDENGTPIESAPEFYGARLATRNLHPVESQSSENCTPQMGVAGPWHERLPHFKMGFQPSTGEELQCEYFIPIEHAFDAIMAMEQLHEKISPHLYISEIRSIAADDFWLSPCYKKNCIAIHTTWKQDTVTVMKLIPELEEKLEPFHAIPHWAKLFTMSPSGLQQRFEKIGKFRKLAQEHDPNGKFRNEFLDRYIYHG
jgi:alditol oxidase